MGASWSSIFGIGDNKSTRQILDTILKRLITETDMRDMYGLADKEVCKKFVVFGTKAFNKLFVKVKLNNKPDGTLFFQQLRGLGDQNPDSDRQLANCKQLASFFVGIFQIYAAIALSIFDSAMPDIDVSAKSVQQASYKSGVKFYNPLSAFKGFSREGVPSAWGQQGVMQAQRGGAFTKASESRWFYINDSDAPYNILNKYLTLPDSPELEANDTHFPIESKFTTPYGEMSIHHTALYEDYDENAETATATATATGIPAPPTTANYTRKVKADLRTKGVPFVADVVIGRDREPIQVTAILKLTTNASSNIEMEVTNIQDSSNTKYTHFQHVLSTSISNGLLMIKNMHFPAYILQEIAKQYNDQNKIPFNALDFFLKYGVVDGSNQIRDSDFNVTGPEENDPEMLEVEYSPKEAVKLTSEDAKRRIKIQMKLEVGPIQRKTERENYKYDVRLHLTNVKASHSEIEDIFTIYDTYERGGYKHAIFSTGPNNAGVPIQEGYQSSIGAFLQRSILAILNSRDRTPDLSPYSVRGDLRYRQGMPEPYNSESMPAEFRIKDIWKALAKDPPIKPHCMARALQLLNLDAIKGNSNGAFSRVCFTDKDKFALIGDGSLPTPGQNITSAVGVKALSMLFLKAIDTSADRLKHEAQYIKFKRQFEKYEDNFQKEGDTVPTNLTKVTDQVMPFCKDHQNERISLNSNMTSQLRSKVNDLQYRQNQHVSNSMYILFKLFNEREIRAGRFELSDYVWQGGTDALQKIAIEAKDLLADYYTDCEKTYKDGLYILYNTVRPTTANPKGAPSEIKFIK